MNKKRKKALNQLKSKGIIKVINGEKTLILPQGVSGNPDGHFDEINEYIKDTYLPLDEDTTIVYIEEGNYNI